VIHPDFIDEIQFFPGGAPVLYGGYTGGIIDGRTKRAQRDEHLLDFAAHLLQPGRPGQPIPQLDATHGRRPLRSSRPSSARDQPGVAVVLGLPVAADGGNAQRLTIFASAPTTSSTRRADRRSQRPNPPLARR
jgi:hypothetical protein